jgi:hypothetical protein
LYTTGVSEKGRREEHSLLGAHPPPPNIRAAHILRHLFACRRLQTHTRVRFLVRHRAAGRPSRPPGAGLEVSEAALQSENRRRETALQIRRRPLLHSADGTVPDSFVPSHHEQRKRKTIAVAPAIGKEHLRHRRARKIPSDVFLMMSVLNSV